VLIAVARRTLPGRLVVKGWVQVSRVWLITGSSRGLGRGLAEAALAAGERVVASARVPAQLSDLAERYGGQVRTVALDVTDQAQAAAAVRVAVQEFGRLDVVVNNAGYGHLCSIEQAADKDLRDQIETNLWGVINVTRAALPVLRQQRSGHFFQISSIGGRAAAGPGLVGYITAKHAVEGFSEVLYTEVAPLGVKVTIIEPGAFRTDWAGSSLKVTEPTEDYRASVGQLIEYFRGAAGNESGDPARAAQIILEVAGMAEPPLRLLLGGDAIDIVRRADLAKLAEIEKWDALSRSTGYDAGTARIAPTAAPAR
jgi:NAD(P)-dependent dehydrogenase (short-subunit alcohol dehydrogenase family)